MKQTLARNICNLLPLLCNSKPNSLRISPFRSTFSSLSSLNCRRLFSSEISKSSEESDLGQSHNDDVDDADKLSNKELKKQIEKLYDGDEEAFASVFEAILNRKLTGKTDELDEELLNELPNQPRVDEDDKESDSD